jgi:hypothetical protein
MRKAKKIDRATQHPAQAVRILFLLGDAELHDLFSWLFALGDTTRVPLAECHGALPPY